METVNITFDSHEKYKALLSKGFSEEQAEGIVDIFSNITFNNAVTKEDLRKIEKSIQHEIKDLGSFLKDDLSNMDGTWNQEVKILIELVAKAEKEMGSLETRLTKLIYINTFTTIAVLGTLFKLFT